ncbi:hypothetical protein RM780_07870 [Streptomyces sp. DSM 44917]|uniref:Holin n=1 Tax=Streptomyces boetiae TaxID=3075541 RepID=A0ABU2L5P7_9ACTN|nr:hypothetical protein [Streptomyces sp. DSM 44917]MDT0306879.1 hypothetical protein [Streptomyces sp. DSM 44917]
MRTILGREPALVLGTLSALLSLAVTLGLDITTEQAGAIVAATSAAFATATALMTRPVAPSAGAGLVTAGAALLGAYGLDVAPETVGAVNAALVSVLALVTRAQVSPARTADDPLASYRGRDR